MIKKIIFILLLFIFPIFTLSFDRINDSVEILILSKQLRFIKETKIEKLNFYFPENTVLENKNSGDYINIKNFKLLFNNQWIIDSIETQITNNIEIKCTNNNSFKKKYFTVEIDNEKRKYPLPLSISLKNNNLKIIIKENKFQYSIDSAVAEYGIRPQKDREAVFALAHLILARTNYPKNKKDYDFTDLTNSQVYKGKLSNNKEELKNSWFINYSKLKENLFFHSSCGGELYSTQVFGKKKNKKTKKDILYRSQQILCNKNNKTWERKLSILELEKILNFENKKIQTITYNKPKKIKIFFNNSFKTFPIETFRLKINRKKGWNFIKSNNFSILHNKKNNNFTFKGKGLGHGVGLCQHGALSLSQKGYNRYEILKHYYPNLKFSPSSFCKIKSSPFLSYYIFNIHSGQKITSNNKSILNRTFAPGSFWKIIVALYLAKERPDIFNDYHYNCSGFQKNDINLPKRCWTIKGHKTNNLQDAIAKSCNLYFASLYKYIEFEKFSAFYKTISLKLGIETKLPKIENKKELASLLSGLNFNFSLTTKNIVNLLIYIHPDNKQTDIPNCYKLKIYNAMEKTFLIGTAKIPLKKYGNKNNFLALTDNNEISKVVKQDFIGLWGKTSTIIDGTNKPRSLGMFMGGYQDKGIVF